MTDTVLNGEARVSKLLLPVVTFLIVSILSWTGYNTWQTALAVERLSQGMRVVENNTEHVQTLVGKDLAHITQRMNQYDDRFKNITARIRILEGKVNN